MSMSTHVVGFKPPDEKWRAMKAIWDACESGGIAIPKEVNEYFGYDTPDESGVVVQLGKSGCLKPYTAEMQEGFEIEIAKLPPDVKIIRFWNSY